MPDSSFNEQVNNKENEIIQENELKNSSSKEDYCSALFHEKTQKEINNNEKIIMKKHLLELKFMTNQMKLIIQVNK